MKMPRWNIGIVGGGPGGLFTAYLLEQYHSTPLNITIFESTNRLGGKLLTERFSSSDIHYEAGAAEFYDYSVIDEDPLRELIEQFGLRTQSMGGASIVRGKTVLGTIEDAQDNLGEVTLQEFLRFNNRAKSEVSPRQFYDSTSTSHINAWGTSLQDERFNHALDQLANTTKNYIQQYIHSDLATEPSQTSHRYGLDNYLMNDPAYMQLYSITGGNDLLIDAVACRLSADVRLNANVTAIKKGVGNTLELSWKATGGSKSEGFDAVVIALPIKPLKKLEFPDSDLASAMQSHIAHHDHPADYLRITILFEKPFWKSWLHDSYCMLDAFDGCCLYDESSRIPEANHGVLGWLLGGAAAQKMAEYSDEELIPAAINSLPFQRDEAKELFREAKIHRWLGAVSAQPGGFQQRQNDAKHCPDIAACPHLLVVGDYLFDSTLNGVLDSADYAAGWITTMAAAQEQV